ncbi:MAG: hypothetical protein ACLTTO_06015 [Lachnospiraceae bacterium]
MPGKEEIMEAYRKLADLLKGKNYFLLTVNTDDLIFESAIDSERIVATMRQRQDRQCSDKR